VLAEIAGNLEEEPTRDIGGGLLDVGHDQGSVGLETTGL
jgi:hypothetical protein